MSEPPASNSSGISEPAGTNPDLRLALTRAENAEKLLIELQPLAEIGRFALNSRHDINNTLSSLIGNAELLLTGMETLRPQVRDQIRSIHDMGIRLYDLLQRMSAMQKQIRRPNATRMQRPKRSSIVLKSAPQPDLKKDSANHL